MRVLITNDDGIQATGLHALRDALRGIAGARGPRDRPGLEPQRDRAQHHDALAALGRGDPLRRRLERLRHRRNAGRLRPLRRARPARRAARADRLRDQPRLQPRRRHHLLGHGRRGAGGDRARHPGDRDLPAVGGPGDGLPLGPRVRLLGRRPRSRRSWSAASREDPLPADTLLNVNCPAGSADRDRGDPSRQAPLQRRDEAGRRGRRAAGAATRSTASSPRSRTSRAPTSRRSPAGGSR